MESSPMRKLPETAAFVELHLLDGGSFIASTDKLHAGVENETFRLYDWAFHIYHPGNGEHMLWDLGIGNNRADYTPWVNKYMLDVVQWAGPRKPIPVQLEDLGVKSDQVARVIFSHAHWDHCRPIRNTFPFAKGYFGPGTKKYCSPGHLVTGASDPDVQWDGRFFDPNNATEVWEELDGPWTKFGPFDKALDLFGDGSLWLIQAPGHLPGNLCAIARLESGAWVLLGGDCCHSRGLFDGRFDIAIWELPNGGSMSLHCDMTAARETISKLRSLEKEYGVHVALAHDAEWMKSGQDQALMSILTDQMKEFARGRLLDDEPA